jgi:hypothetical protein
MFRFGGTNGFQWFNDVWCYDPIPNSWTQLDCIGYIPAPREGHAAALVDDVMYIFGGRTEEGADLGDLAAFRITSRRWYTFQNMGPSPSPRSGHSMTAFAKQIVVLAGEPSSATREVQDLSIIYMLDTTKIRYPNDQMIQQTPAGERVPGRRPSDADKRLATGPRGPVSRDGSQGPPDSRRLNGQPMRESIMGNMHGAPRGNGPPGVNGNDMNGVAPGSAQPQGPGAGSKLPRASIMQAPSGPPPQQQAPNRPNGVPQSGNPPRNKPQTRQDQGYGPPIDTSVRSVSRNASQERDGPITTPLSPATRDSPVTNGRRTPTQPAGKPALRPDANETPVEVPKEPVARTTGSASKLKHGRQQGSLESIGETSLRNVTNRANSPPPPARSGSNGMSRKGSARNSQTVALLKELDAARNRNAWYASELELAKKAGYAPGPSPSPILDQRAADSFSESDRPLIEALIAMRNELANVQGSVDQQAVLAAKKIAEVEKQRDAAVAEAVYAKAKLAAHGGSQASTPQPDNDSRDLSSRSGERSTDIAKKLAAALGFQRELQNQIEMLTAEAEAEKKGRQLAEDTASTAQARISDLELYKQRNASEVESLKAELHQTQMEARQQATMCTEATTRVQLLEVDKENLESRYKELEGNSKDQTETFESLREAITASHAMKALFERKLDEERSQREIVEDKLRKLRTEHEERTSELEAANQRLTDAEEMAEKHSTEAQSLRQAVLAGLDSKILNKDLATSPTTSSEKLASLQAQIESANGLVRKYQAAADSASEKLRSAEERIAGLEAYQEQVSREGMGIRKQLQSSMRDVQTLQAANSEMKHQLANQQLETNAVHVQHNTLKDLLGERGISPVGAVRARGLNSPQLRTDSPDQARLRELEQQLLAAQQAHDETKQLHATREQEVETTYRDKLAQLENDYQSAVHYVKGTEKMLKRMKDELSKCKIENTRLKGEVDELHSKADASQSSSTEWDTERDALGQQIENLQSELQASHAQLEQQLSDVRQELSMSQQERDHFKQSHDEAQRQLSDSMQQSRADLSQLQQENDLLEKRALDAEQKVSLLLDQVETSVDNYRRQSSITNDGADMNRTHSRKLSGIESISGDSTYSDNTERANDRNSMALDSLASELETLRTHWETTNKNYRLSTNFDFERPTPVTEEASDGKVDLSNSLADWRKRLESEENESRSRKGSGDNTLHNGVTQQNLI